MPPSADPAGRLNLRQMVIWGVFMALLVLGVVLWFRFANRIVPMLDAFTDR
jgi:cytochrome c-type biogenesis protein CcmH/NrfF